MSRLSQLLQKARSQDPHLAEEIEREIKHLQQRRSFGLNFERHTPESVELPGRKVRRGDKVRILPPRGENPTKDSDLLWTVARVDRDTDTAFVEPLDHDAEPDTAALDDLVVTAEFTDPIYPGLVSTGKVERGGDKPFHTVINSENYHALETLLFTHQGKVDAIYIDPPYNTGAKDWKYNNSYVDNDDVYRHSKWLAFMERRLKLAKELLKPNDSVLAVTIDEHEVHRLGVLLEQLFPNFHHQTVTTVINPKGVTQGYLSRVEEYVMFAFAPETSIHFGPDDLLTHRQEVHAEDTESGPSRPRWKGLLRSGDEASRQDREQMFYPVWIDPEQKKLISAGDWLPLAEEPAFDARDGDYVAVWPVRKDLSLGRWGVGADTLNNLIKAGYANLGNFDKRRNSWGITYLSAQVQQDLAEGKLEILSRDPINGVVDVAFIGAASQRTKTTWHRTSHDAGAYGTDLLGLLLSDRKFPKPKSLYAVEDSLRVAVGDKPSAVVLDFFAGSGTTAHAVMRLNKQDGGRRQSISVTNNEVSVDEQKQLRAAGHRPGDPEWEALGICDYITKPRITAAITGRTPDDEPINGDYKFTDEFPMADGFEENAEFFTLTYEAPSRVARNRDFARIAPLLWLAAGAEGRRVDDVTAGWDVAEAYGVLASLDHTQEFVEAMTATDTIRYAFVVTDDERSYQRIADALPRRVEAVRLYEQYLKNFEILVARSAR